MDPIAALSLLCSRADPADRAAAASGLIEWLDRGGAPPVVDGDAVRETIAHDTQLLWTELPRVRDPGDRAEAAIDIALCLGALARVLSVRP